jgi:hypothetical protein
MHLFHSFGRWKTIIQEKIQKEDIVFFYTVQKRICIDCGKSQLREVQS